MSRARFIQFAISMVLAVAWFQSAAAHIGNPYYFLASVYKYQIVGPRIGYYIAMLLPGLQLVLSICLVSRLYVASALLGSAILLTLFTGVQYSALVRRININCGCFGPGHSMAIGEGSLILVLTLSAMAYVAFFCVIVEQRRNLAPN
jgi:hypothetical protein